MPVEVHNYIDGDIVSHSLALITGCVTPLPTQANIRVTNLTIQESDSNSRLPLLDEAKYLWPIFNTQFKALVPLTLGENKICFEHGCEDFLLTLYFSAPTFSRFVRPVYIICADDIDGYFQAPNGEDCSIKSACNRISLGSRLLQTFTANKLAEHGLGKKTFVLEKDLFPDKPSCHVFRSKMCLSDVYSMTGGELWVAFAKELMACELFDQRENCKWLAFMSFTRYCPPEGEMPKSHSQVLEFTKGHTALGGGGLALFGTGTLHTWAEHLSQVVTCFTDPRKIDRASFMDDSAYRETYWANYSTGLGAALHELGHTFDLAHTPTGNNSTRASDVAGIMARGFDDLYRVFTVQPLLSRRGSLASESRTASPIAYSPRQSPVHSARKRVNSTSENGSRSNSPVYSFNSLPRVRTRTDSGGSTNGSAASPHNTFQIESDFKKLSVQTTQSFTSKNYDGSETRKTIARYRDGMETVAEITWCPSGEELVRETVKNLASGKTRTVLSLTLVGSDIKDKSASSQQNQKHHISRSLDEIAFTKAAHRNDVTNNLQIVTKPITRHHSLSDDISYDKWESRFKFGTPPTVRRVTTALTQESENIKSNVLVPDDFRKRVGKSEENFRKVLKNGSNFAAENFDVTDSSGITGNSGISNNNLTSDIDANFSGTVSQINTSLTNGHNTEIKADNFSKELSKTGEFSSVPLSKSSVNVNGNSDSFQKTKFDATLNIPAEVELTSHEITENGNRTIVPLESVSKAQSLETLSRDTIPQCTCSEQALPGSNCNVHRNSLDYKEKHSLDGSESIEASNISDSKTGVKDTLGEPAIKDNHSKSEGALNEAAQNNNEQSADKSPTKISTCNLNQVSKNNNVKSNFCKFSPSKPTLSSTPTQSPKRIFTHSHITTPSRITTQNPQVSALRPPGQEDILAYRPRRKEGGAHWYRSSAVVLNYHPWLNEDHSKERKASTSINKFRVSSEYGLRLVEIRQPPDGVVVHHWEFTAENPPITFDLPVGQFYDIFGIDIKQFTVLAIDTVGNLAKKKFDLTSVDKPVS